MEAVPRYRGISAALREAASGEEARSAIEADLLTLPLGWRQQPPHVGGQALHRAHERAVGLARLKQLRRDLEGGENCGTVGFAW